MAYDFFPIEMKVKFWCNFCVYTKNWSFEKHRIGIIALLWQPILQKLNLKCCCHFCFLWLPTIWRDFFAEKKEIKKFISMHFLQRFVLHFVLFGLFWANKYIVSRIRVVITYCYLCLDTLNYQNHDLISITPKISSNCLVCSDCLHS